MLVQELSWAEPQSRVEWCHGWRSSKDWELSTQLTLDGKLLCSCTWAWGMQGSWAIWELQCLEEYKEHGLLGNLGCIGLLERREKDGRLHTLTLLCEMLLCMGYWDWSIPPACHKLTAPLYTLPLLCEMLCNWLHVLVWSALLFACGCSSSMQCCNSKRCMCIGRGMNARQGD